jgi:hypothetical protein
LLQLVQAKAVHPAGFEQPQDSPRKTALSTKGGAKSGALPADLVEAWPELPEELRRAILALVDSKRGSSADRAL